MAKPNKQKNKPNFFDKNIAQYGDNFLDYIKPHILMQDGIRLCRDMAYGNIDVTRYIQYFGDARLLAAMEQGAFSKYSFYNISAAGVEMLRKDMSSKGQEVSPTILTVLNFHIKASEAYNYILNAVYAAKSGNLTPMIALPANLRNYRNYV